MVRAITACVVVLTAVVVAGCATRVNVDYDKSINFSKFHSFHLLAKSDKSTTDTRLNSPFIDKRIATALQEYLQAKGFVLKSDQPDFAVTYQINLTQEIVSDNRGVSMMFGTGIGRRAGFGLGYSIPGVDVESEEKCLLTIDIVSSTSNELLWRGTSSRRIANGSTPEKTDLFFKALVAEIVGRFPPP